LRYPLSIISPLSNSDCWALAMHPTEDILYVGTIAGVTVLDYTPAPAVATNLSRVYLYPNPVYRSRGHNEIMIQNITGPVSIEVYNLEGVLVHSQTVDANGQVAWDLTTETGFLVGSGNYLVRVVGPDGAVTKTISVLR
ncbi:MAG TPA: T9SS type A sorting domain-containing protein, partial [Candidatus Krumholzibacteria bacterium]|nr:T9SS type A sorting domain-containing protein [Candidatus Krumholzibacteria bacterium]